MGRKGWRRMKANLGALRLAIGLVASLSVCGPALSQKPDLTEATLFGAELSAADLSGADLRWSELNRREDIWLDK